MNSKYLSLAIGLVAATVSTYAVDKNKSENLLKSDCKSLCFAGPVLECDNSLEVMAAALYAQVRADASEVALFNGSTEGNPKYPEQAKGIEPTEKASWGFKVGLGWKTGHDDWKLAARYTWFRAISDGSYQQSYSGAYVPTEYSNPYVAGFRTSTNVRSFANLEAGNYTWISDLNVYLTRPTLYTKYLEISPYFGIDFNLLRRRQTIFFSKINDNPQPSEGYYLQTYDRNFSWGVGPMTGVASRWMFGYDVSVVAESYLALTYGEAESYSDTTSYDPEIPTNNISAVISNQVYQFSPDLYFHLGLEWGKNFDDNTKAFALRIAYENDYYFQVNKTIVNDLRYRLAEMGAVGYQGLVLQGQFDF
jgi:hypothetical protein